MIKKAEQERDIFGADGRTNESVPRGSQEPKNLLILGRAGNPVDAAHALVTLHAKQPWRIKSVSKVSD